MIWNMKTKIKVNIKINNLWFLTDIIDNDLINIQTTVHSLNNLK